MALSPSARITLFLVIDVVFFFVKLIVGYAVGSFALIADSLHMLDNVINLIVALYAIKMTASSSTDSRYSYGTHRAETVAALIRGAFLLGLCFSRLSKAIRRFDIDNTPEISSPKLVVVVGSFGLAFNILGLFFNHEHGHSRTKTPTKTPTLRDDSLPGPLPTEHTPLLQENLETARTHNHRQSDGSMDMRALGLHDALGNVGIISTGLVIWLTQWSLKNYFDPVVGLARIIHIIFSRALPLVRSASFILLEGVPSTISLHGVRDSILQVDGVLSVHELHVWQLSESKVVASVHVRITRNHDFMPIAAEIRAALHHHGIHSDTIQPEYVRPGSQPETSCLVLCPPDQACDPEENACCPPLPVDRNFES